tara:strand:- start:39 stop:722 length:684 start_codon:yes stop_codon:yes gene_type:complete
MPDHLIEHDIIHGNSIKVFDQLPSVSKKRLDALWLLSVHFEHEDISLCMLDKRHKDLSDSIIEETFKSAAVHNEDKLIDRILELRPKALSKQTILDAIRMAATRKNINCLQVMAKYNTCAQYMNEEDKENPHLLIMAIDQEDEWMLRKILELPPIHPGYHHIIYAEKRKRNDLARILSAYKEHEKHLDSAYQDMWQYEIDQCWIGAHVQSVLYQKHRENYRRRTPFD